MGQPQDYPEGSQNSIRTSTSSTTTTGPTYSPDGQCEWDGARWQPVLSADGSKRWNGFQWVPADDSRTWNESEWVPVPRPPGTYDADPMPYGAARPPARRHNRLALASMICGIVGMVLSLILAAGFVVGIPALIMGYMARSQIKHSGGVQTGSDMARAGIATGWAATALSLVVLPLIILLARAGGM